MRLVIPCMKCGFDSVDPREKYTSVEFRDDGRFELECERGHRTVTILQEAKYEVLFEIGLNAIIDGYYREAVSSFAACLERFYEFSVGVLLEEAGVARGKVRSTWKLVSTSSERQLGAFALLWLRHFSEVPALLSTNDVAFRNDVIHKGLIPTAESATAFGDAVLVVILPKLARIAGELSESLGKSIFHTLSERRTEGDTRLSAGTMTIPTAFRLAQAEPEVPHSVASNLLRIAQARRRTNGAVV